MISSAATNSLDRVFEGALRDISVATDDECCSVRQLDALPIDGVPAVVNQVVACNISAFTFRLVVFFSFPVNDVTSRFFCRKFQLTKKEDKTGELDDAAAEFVNMASGRVKSALTTVTGYTGMSTPFMLDGRCRFQLPALKPAHTRYFDVTGSDEFRYEAGYCVCVGAASRVEFSINEALPTEDNSAGGLELF